MKLQTNLHKSAEGWARHHAKVQSLSQPHSARMRHQVPTWVVQRAELVVRPKVRAVSDIEV